jgi:hypothetical protein
MDNEKLDSLIKSGIETRSPDINIDIKAIDTKKKRTKLLLMLPPICLLVAAISGVVIHFSPADGVYTLFDYKIDILTISIFSFLALLVVISERMASRFIYKKRDISSLI